MKGEASEKVNSRGTTKRSFFFIYSILNVKNGEIYTALPNFRKFNGFQTIFDFLLKISKNGALVLQNDIIFSAHL